jgi:DNA-binding transcriptional regulator YbjK
MSSFKFPEVPRHAIKIVPKSQQLYSQIEQHKNELLRTKNTEQKVAIVSKMHSLKKQYDAELEKEKMKSLMERRKRLGGSKRKTRSRRKTRKARRKI